MKRRTYACVHPDDEEYYSWDKLLSHGADVSIAMSVRDLGKSYGIMQRTIRKAADAGRNSVITRWEVAEAEKMAVDMFSDSDIYSAKDTPDGQWSKVSVSTSVWYFERRDNHAQVWFMSVKASNKNKGADIKNLDWWFYDEFIPEQYDTQTRRIQEFDRFVSMYWTLIRNNTRFRVVMACNTITWFNGYFDAWNIRPFSPGMIVKQHIHIAVDGIERTLTVAIENVKPTRRQLERILKNAAISGRKFKQDYFDNVTGDNMGFIASCPDMTEPLFSAQWLFMKRCYSFRYHNGLYYWCECARRNVDTYTTSKTDVGPGVIRDRQMGRTFDELYDSGQMRFADGHVEQAVLSMIWAGRQNQI